MKGCLFLKKAGITCLFLFFGFQRSSSASTCYFTADQEQAYQLLLKLEFKECIRSLKGNHIYNFQIKSMALCLEAFINCDKQKYQLGRRMAIKWVDSLSNYPECAEKRFVKSQVKLHWAFLASSYGEKVSGAIEMRQAYLLLKENYQKYPNHKPTLLYYGLFNALIAEIPDNYQWLANFVGLKPSGRKGFDMVELARNCNQFLDFEKNALLLLRKPQSEAQQIVSDKACDYLMEIHGNKDLVRFMVSFYYLKNKNTNEAIRIFKSTGHSEEPMLIYQKALTSYNTLDIDTAVHYFKKFSKVNRAESFKKDVTLKLAYLYSLKGDSVQAGRYKASVKKIGIDATYADKTAEKSASLPIPEFLLLKARILFDAGNWADAKRFLLLWKPADATKKTEYFYRLARVEKELGNIDISKKYYKDCVGICARKGNYYGPFACLFLAEIYYKDKNAVISKHYLSESKMFTDFEYQQTYILKFTEISKLLK